MVQTSYDIIKAHGDELKVETKEGEGAEFIIQLPLRLTIQSAFLRTGEKFLH